MSQSGKNQGLTQIGNLLHHDRHYQAHRTPSQTPQNIPKNMPDGINPEPKNTPPPANDILSDPRFPDFFNCDNNDMQVFHSQNPNDTPQKYSEQFAHFLAEGLGDLENLALYKSYCQKYPVGVVLDAFQRAKETPSEKIKTSRGALFNYLTKVYAQKTNTKNSGHSSGASRNGRRSF